MLYLLHADDSFLTDMMGQPTTPWTCLRSTTLHLWISKVTEVMQDSDRLFILLISSCFQKIATAFWNARNTHAGTSLIYTEIWPQLFSSNVRIPVVCAQLYRNSATFPHIPNWCWLIFHKVYTEQSRVVRNLQLLFDCVNTLLLPFSKPALLF